MDSTIPTVDEAPFWIEVNGRIAGSGSCTPERLEALAAGWLLAEGFIERAADLYSLRAVAASDGSFGLHVECDPDRAATAEAARRHRFEHGCGPLHGVRCDPARLSGPARALPLPTPELFPTLFRALFAGAARFRETGGVHSAALTDGESLRYEANDVSRHAAVDKVIGMAVLAGADHARLGLVLTARISGEIAFKAARSGVAWIASRSIPTTLAVRIADAGGLPLVARAASREPYVHLHDAGSMERP